MFSFGYQDVAAFQIITARQVLTRRIYGEKTGLLQLTYHVSRVEGIPDIREGNLPVVGIIPAVYTKTHQGRTICLTGRIDIRNHPVFLLRLRETGVSMILAVSDIVVGTSLLHCLRDQLSCRRIVATDHFVPAVFIPGFDIDLAGRLVTGGSAVGF